MTIPKQWTTKGELCAEHHRNTARDDSDQSGENRMEADDSSVSVYIGTDCYHRDLGPFGCGCPAYDHLERGSRKEAREQGCYGCPNCKPPGWEDDE